MSMTSEVINWLPNWSRTSPKETSVPSYIATRTTRRGYVSTRRNWNASVRWRTNTTLLSWRTSHISRWTSDRTSVCRSNLLISLPWHGTPTIISCSSVGQRLSVMRVNVLVLHVSVTNCSIVISTISRHATKGCLSAWCSPRVCSMRCHRERVIALNMPWRR